MVEVESTLTVVGEADRLTVTVGITIIVAVPDTVPTVAVIVTLPDEPPDGDVKVAVATPPVVSALAVTVPKVVSLIIKSTGMLSPSKLPP
jgi:hypothetical protein